MNDTQTAQVLTIKRTFNAPRDRVFAAFTNPELLRDWFGPPGTILGDVRFEAREGGRYRVEMRSSAGEVYNVKGVISAFEPPALLAYTFRWEEDDPQLERDTFVRIEFIARGAHTEIALTQENFASDDSRSRHDTGWNDSFDRLDAALAPPIRIRGIDLSGYMVQDAKRAIGFYRTVFGLEPTLIYPEDRGAEYDLPDGTTFGLWGGGGTVMPFQPSNGILFAVDDLDDAVATLRARDITVRFEGETPNCRLAMLNDTEGNIVTLHERKAR